MESKEYIKAEPMINDEGIWMPVESFVPSYCEPAYKLVMTKEMFVEAYNKWIKGVGV